MSDIVLMGATYPSVPAVQLPKAGGGTATFTETAGSQTFTENGTYDVTSLAQAVVDVSGGGSADLVLGAIRPDAELVQRWAYDKLAVEDLGATIPAYSTSTTTIVSSSTLSPRVAADVANYDYFVCLRALVYPIYASGTGTGKGRFVYSLGNMLYEVSSVPAGTYRTGTGNAYNNMSNATFYTGQSRTYYWSSASATSITTSASNGVYFSTPNAPAFSGTAPNYELIVYSPAGYLKGHATYLSQTYFDAIEDIRYQYVIEAYRAPKGNLNLDGWGATQQYIHIADCYANGGTLT